MDILFSFLDKKNATFFKGGRLINGIFFLLFLRKISLIGYICQYSLNVLIKILHLDVRFLFSLKKKFFFFCRHFRICYINNGKTKRKPKGFVTFFHRFLNRYLPHRKICDLPKGSNA